MAVSSQATAPGSALGAEVGLQTRASLDDQPAHLEGHRVGRAMRCLERLFARSLQLRVLLIAVRPPTHPASGPTQGGGDLLGSTRRKSTTMSCGLLIGFVVAKRRGVLRGLILRAERFSINPPTARSLNLGYRHPYLGEQIREEEEDGVRTVSRKPPGTDDWDVRARHPKSLLAW